MCLEAKSRGATAVTPPFPLVGGAVVVAAAGVLGIGRGRVAIYHLVSFILEETKPNQSHSNHQLCGFIPRGSAKSDGQLRRDCGNSREKRRLFNIDRIARKKIRQPSPSA